jgi:hypothetical protein
MLRALLLGGLRGRRLRWSTRCTGWLGDYLESLADYGSCCEICCNYFTSDGFGKSGVLVYLTAIENGCLPLLFVSCFRVNQNLVLQNNQQYADNGDVHR